MDMNKEREAFEAYLKSIDVDMYYIPNIIFDSAIYRFKDEFNADEDQEAALEEINTGWFAWIKCAEYKQAEINELKAKLEAAQVPEGFVLVPKECPDPIFADKLFDLLCKKAHGEFGDDQMIFFSDINESEIWEKMIEAAQGEGHE